MLWVNTIDEAALFSLVEMRRLEAYKPLYFMNTHLFHIFIVNMQIESKN